MTSFLSTGESEYCQCGHHITDHEEGSDPSMNARICISTNYYRCCECNQCNQFVPYRRLNEVKTYSFGPVNNTIYE